MMENNRSLLRKVKENIGLKVYMSMSPVKAINLDEKLEISEIEKLTLALLQSNLYHYYPYENGTYITSDNDKRINDVKNEIIHLLNCLSENNAKLKSKYQKFYASEKEIPPVVSNILNNPIGYCKKTKGFKFFNKYKTDRALINLSKFGCKSKEQSYLLQSSQKEFLKNPIYKQLLNIKNAAFIMDVISEGKKCAKLLSPDLGTETMRFGLLMECFNRDYFNKILSNCAKMNIDVRKFLQTNDNQRKSEYTSEIEK